MDRPLSIFPPAHQVNEDGIIATYGDLDSRSLISAYGNGIFPWPHEGYPLLWFHPLERGILDFSSLHISRSLEKLRRKQIYEFSIDQAFSEVIKSCARQERPDQGGTWIFPEMISAYENLHQLGYAHSLEAWHQGELVGGIYGVSIGPLFSAESMFYKISNVSKLCFLELCDLLQFKGASWIDVQMVTPLTKSFGAQYISQKEFCHRLDQEWNSGKVLFSLQN